MIVGVAVPAMLLAGCSALTLDAASPTSGNGWELLDEVEGGPEAGVTWASSLADPPRARAVTDQGQLEAAWDELDLAGSPPQVDHDTTFAVLYTTPTDCGGLEDVLLVGDQVRISLEPVDVDDCDQRPRTFVFGLDREALEDTPSLTWGGNPMDEQRPMATSPREEPLAFPDERGPFRASVEEDADGTQLITVRFADDDDPAAAAAPDRDAGPLALQPDQLVVWRWDGLQWRDVPSERVVQVVPSQTPEDESVAAVVGIASVQAPDGLEDGTYVALITPFGPSATEDDEQVVRTDEPRVVVPFDVRDDGQTVELDPAR